MKEFKERLAVVTGGGAGMGRELALQLAREGCHVAICDVSLENMEETRRLCLTEAPEGTRFTIHRCDVSEETQVQGFRDAVLKEHETEAVHLLFNNAGIGGGGSFVNDTRESWDRTFAICWNGVYNCSRAFLPSLLAAPAAHLVNTSSINGLWASLGPFTPHTAYSAAKFAVRGFTEALITDLRLNAPHVKVSLVMPGHIGTSIIENSGKLLGRDPDNLSAEDLTAIRDQLTAAGFPVGNLPDDDIKNLIRQRAKDFRDNAPTSAVDAATVILDGVRAERWRILIGDDARVVDQLVREDPENVYEPAFIQRLADQGQLEQLIQTTQPIGPASA